MKSWLTNGNVLLGNFFYISFNFKQSYIFQRLAFLNFDFAGKLVSSLASSALLWFDLVKHLNKLQLPAASNRV